MTQIRAVIFDWAGTTVDYGCFAPTMVFVEGFKAHGVDITLEEARGPMGTYKRDHIAAVLHLPRVTAAWEQAHGRTPTEADIDAIFADFIPRQLAVIAHHSDPIPGAIEAVALLREHGIGVGSCTGYTRAMMDVLIPAAAANGYTVDVCITPDDTGAGRPAPYMLWRNLERLGVYPAWQALKIGDTESDMHEARMAGAWAVGVALTGNELGLSAADAAALSAAEREARLQAIRAKLMQAGAHLVVDSVADIASALDHINARLAAGKRP